jgi:hypothetical protein
MNDGINPLIRYTKENGRVCPKPDKWNKLWELLPDRKRVGAGWNPPLPLILAAWRETSDDQKRERLSLHIHYAADHGALEKIETYLRGLSKDDWIYEGDI